ncbi:MAG TPA: type II toxin-antitoxin system VapC family toxin [Stellaceae bacterium]|nr:type II toxin-antitoxin system VapC family toxin [Stellaceae bacterium]
MIGLDSNIIVRYLTQDDPLQAAQAGEVIEQRLSEEEPGFISVVAMAEIVWTLTRFYRFPSARIVGALERILAVDILVIENEAEVFVAMSALRDGRDEFGDALIGALSAAAGCSRVLTFDRGALALPGFAMP